jgi:predicted adenylyl cyclase CyaB
MREVLSRALGVRRVVRKRRTVFHVGRTRVHFDEVEGLGRFIELEVVLGPGEDEAAGATEAKCLMAALGIGEADLVEGAYAEMPG